MVQTNEGLTLRRNGTYWQLGYYSFSKWITVAQLGTPAQILDLVRQAKPHRINTYNEQNIPIPSSSKINEIDENIPNN